MRCMNCLVFAYSIKVSKKRGGVGWGGGAHFWFQEVQPPVPVNINSATGKTALKQEYQMQNLQVWDISEHV